MKITSPHDFMSIPVRAPSPGSTLSSKGLTTQMLPDYRFPLPSLPLRKALGSRCPPLITPSLKLCLPHMAQIPNPSGGIRTGLWKTASGSALHLVIHGEDAHGTYQTAHGQPDSNEHFHIKGFVNGDLIGFVTSWGKYKSVTSWVGRYYYDSTRDQEYIVTIWHLARDYADRAHAEPNEIWESFHTLSDIYYLQNQTSNEESTHT